MRHFVLTVIESPYAGATPEEIERNLRYLRACMADSLARGEAPYASHAIYTQPGVLDDSKPDERTKGMEAGFAWGMHAQLRAIYTDLGIRLGMRKGIEMASMIGQPVEYRAIGWNEKTSGSELAAPPASSDIIHSPAVAPQEPAFYPNANDWRCPRCGAKDVPITFLSGQVVCCSDCSPRRT